LGSTNATLNDEDWGESRQCRITISVHFRRWSDAESARKMAEKAASAIIIQAGTATSTRLRNAGPQSFNWLEVASHDRFSLQVIAWGGTSFLEGSKVAFTYDGGEWQSRKDL
jgi:hypothetical protein